MGKWIGNREHGTEGKGGKRKKRRRVKRGRIEGREGATRAREIEESRGKGRDEEIERWGEKRRREKEGHRQGCTDIYRHTRRYM